MSVGWKGIHSSCAKRLGGERMKQTWLLMLLAASLAFDALPAMASSHGPVFGLATPTNPKGAWSLDLATIGRMGSNSGSAMERAMLSYGITGDVQISVSGPAVFSTAPLPPGRVTAMMPATGDFEAIGAWRFQRRDIGVGSRYETTAYGGIILPGSQAQSSGPLGHLNWAPGQLGMITTGYVSRSNYFWAGVGDMHFDESGGDQRPGMLMWSLDYAYRPKALRKGYSDWDGRFFIEANGEYSDRVLRNHLPMPGTDGEQVFLGPTTLWLYKQYGIGAGIQFPVYRNTGPAFEKERFRTAIDFVYYF